jgi:methionyl-tRNA formyltransferase
MNKKPKIGLFAMTAKGAVVFKTLLRAFGSESISYVVTARDLAVLEDGSSTILQIASEFGVPSYFRPDCPKHEQECVKIAVSWKWMIPVEPDQTLVVFHDSLLPRYRGFNPLVSALINAEEEIGVTALIASDEYDKGPIVAQESTRITYPITISQAIALINSCYEKLAIVVGKKILNNSLSGFPQNESEATFSLWRDDDDYQINWQDSAEQIRRFIDAVGFPYKGAICYMGSKKCRIFECEEIDDIQIENRAPGKVIFLDNGLPIVVCGKGLLKIKNLVHTETSESQLPLQKFRTRFS